MVSGALGVLLVIALYQCIAPIPRYIRSEMARGETLSQDIATSSKLLERFSELDSKRKGIEEAFKKVQFPEGELSYLESIITKILNLAPSTFQIRNLSESPFGGQYTLARFSVDFSISNLDPLTQFLNELSHGDRSMLVNQLSITKKSSGEALDVRLEVSSIKQK